MMNRRRFLAAAATALARSAVGRSQAGTIETANGPLDVSRLGLTLVHEHVLVDFVGADKVNRDRYDAEEVVRVVLPHLRRVRGLGCNTLVECTPAYLGRDPELLRRLSAASGLQIITNTGYYGAADGKYAPAHARSETAEELAARWTDEWKTGISGTRIKPGFIKIGVNKGPLNPLDAKLVRAAALAHLQTGLTIACHTGDGPAASEEVEILQAAGVAPQALMWVHAQNETDLSVHERLARAGTWIELECSGEKSLAERVGQIKAITDRGLIGKTLISLDAGWYHVGEPGGGTFRSYDFFFTRLLPALRDAGISGEQVRMLTVENPARALRPGVRTA
jgi:predicted metal-dependent phosphotriesterase family hydrolase